MKCFSFIKTIMIIFNLLIFICGATLLAVGIWVSVDGGSFLKIFGSLSNDFAQLVNVGYFLIAAGAVLLVLGFLGCYGAHKESRCALMMFFIILLVIFIAEIAAAVVVLVYTNLVRHWDGAREDSGRPWKWALACRRPPSAPVPKHWPAPFSPQADKFLSTAVVPAIQADYGSKSDFTQVWNSTMKGLKCCGFNNYTDFSNSPYFKTYNVYPRFCCFNKSNGTVDTPCTEEKAEKLDVQGCFKQLLDEIQTNSVAVGGVAIGIAALELAAMIVSLYLYSNIN
ncbi:tetraspanin-1 [Ochotona princeps]|uniref:tetraspanin-1 n=1 Tax=Ochotona princeps TaxID=9978 RepID=UPI002714B72B|nr:tetraspanin-1 [Ochotona princeps]XP_058536691.1 tetraspanin-1 [Ochotona princeps]